MVFKTPESDSQGKSSTELTELAVSCLQTSLQKDPENSKKHLLPLPADLAAMTEVWTELPMSIRNAIMALIEPYHDTKGEKV
jgi:hypothetical protein